MWTFRCLSEPIRGQADSTCQTGKNIFRKQLHSLAFGMHVSGNFLISNHGSVQNRKERGWRVIFLEQNIETAYLWARLIFCPFKHGGLILLACRVLSPGETSQPSAICCGFLGSVTVSANQWCYKSGRLWVCSDGRSPPQDSLVITFPLLEPRPGCPAPWFQWLEIHVFRFSPTSQNRKSLKLLPHAPTHPNPLKHPIKICQQINWTWPI